MICFFSFLRRHTLPADWEILRKNIASRRQNIKYQCNTAAKHQIFYLFNRFITIGYY